MSRFYHQTEVKWSLINERGESQAVLSCLISDRVTLHDILLIFHGGLQLVYCRQTRLVTGQSMETLPWRGKLALCPRAWFFKDKNKGIDNWQKSWHSAQPVAFCEMPDHLDVVCFSRMPWPFHSNSNWNECRVENEGWQLFFVLRIYAVRTHLVFNTS